MISLKYLKPPHNRCAKINTGWSITVKYVISTIVYTDWCVAIDIYTYTHIKYVYELRDIINKLLIFWFQFMYDHTFSVSEMDIYTYPFIHSTQNFG